MRWRPGIALAGVLAVMLVGCGTGGNRTPSRIDTYQGGQQSLPSAPATPGASASPAPAFIDKAVGEEFIVTGADGQLAAFTVVAVTVDATCTGSPATPENGHFVRLEIEGSADAALTQPLTFGARAWSVVPADGGALDRDVWTAAAAACRADDDGVPDTVRSGETVSGAVILDVRSPHGTVRFQPATGLAWSWTY